MVVNPGSIPTVTVPRVGSIAVPTVSIPRPTPRPTAAPTARPALPHRKQVHRKQVKAKKPAPVVKSKPAAGEWITAYLTSYCPGSAGWLSSSGRTVHYGMLANNYYPFGTRVYIPVLGMTGVVEDHLGGLPSWNHFDVWSLSCYATPTGYFPVAVQGR